MKKKKQKIEGAEITFPTASQINLAIIEFTKETNILPDQASILELLFWSNAREGSSVDRQMTVESLKNYHQKKMSQEKKNEEEFEEVAEPRSH